MAKLNIGVIGLWNASNLGDPLICESVVYLLHQVIDRSECNIFPIDLFPEHLSLPKVTLSRLLGNRKIKDNGIVTHIDSFLMETTVILLKMENQYRSYFEEIFDQMDCVIFAGGGLIKYKQQQKLSIAISAAVKVASTMKIPVAFHACGVEGYDPKSKGCKRLSKAINNPIVKFVSSRDDFETLANLYKKNPALVVRSAADAAVWANEVTGIHKDESSKIIGLGVARADIFQEYGIDYNDNELIDLFVGIIKSLQRRGVSWKLFCNGYAPDYKFGCKILSELDLDESYIMPFPENTHELVSQISNFQGVVALRLHACIISYSLNIPVLGLCWNQKLKQFGSAIGYPDRFYEVDDFDAEVITKHLLKAIPEGYDQKSKKEYTQSSLDSIKEIVKIVLP